MSDGHDPYAALRSRDYRRLLASNLLASIGTQIQSVAIGYEVYQRTDLPIALGLVGLIQFLPIVLLALPAGHAADRYRRPRIMMTAQTCIALAALGLALVSLFEGPVALIYLFLLVSGISQAFNWPARWALLTEVVAEEDLVNAVTWNSSGWQVASVVGPALGGLIIAAGEGKTAAAYLATTFCTTVCAVLVAGIRTKTEPPPREPLSLESLLAGVRFVRQSRIILATITLDLFAVFFGGATALLPIFARDILQVGPTGLGWLYAAPSAGALVMALTMAHRPPLRRAGRALLAAVAGFGVATVVFGLSRNYVLSFAMLVVTGALDNISVVVRGTLVQVRTPMAMRGRVSAVNAVFIGSSNQLGAFESGVTAQWFGPVLSVVGGGVATLLVIGAVMLAWPEVLRMGSLHEPESDAK